MTIKLLREWDEYPAGTVLDLTAAKEKELIANRTAEASSAHPDGTLPAERKAEPMPAPKPLTVPESLAAFRAHVTALRDQLARGSKSDLDQVGARLDELVAWMDAVIDDKHHNPTSVRTIHIDPVAEHEAAVKAEAAKVAADKAAADKTAKRA